MPKVTSLCEYCHKPIESYSSAFKRRGARRWCSRACQIAATHIWTDCPVCSKRFWYHRSWPRKYCSRACSASVNGRSNLKETGKSIDLACDQCGKAFSRIESEVNLTKLHFCSQACWGAYLAKTQKGIPRPEVAGERPDLQKRVMLICDECHQSFFVKQSSAPHRHFCSKSCMIQAQKRLTGELANGWKGGHPPYYGPNWRQQQRNTRNRDAYTCRRCGITESELGKHLDVHHIRPFREFDPDHYREANALSNLISYCVSCHLEIEHEQNTRPEPLHLPRRD